MSEGVMDLCESRETTQKAQKSQPHLDGGFRQFRVSSLNYHRIWHHGNVI